MPRELAELPKGSRITDYMSLGAIAKSVPLSDVHAVLEESERTSQRQRDLPNHMMVYYVISLGLYMQVSYREVFRNLQEGISWLYGGDIAGKVPAKSAISQARNRLGSEPMRLLFNRVAKPIAKPETKGAWYRKWRLVSIDGSSLDVADTKENEEAFGRHHGINGSGGYPQIKLVTLTECGTRVMFAAALGACHASEQDLARECYPLLKPNMLCLADRGFLGYELWREACDTGSDQLWRIKKNAIFTCIKRLDDGSFLSKVYASPKDRKYDINGIDVRIIEYRLDGIEATEDRYRLVTTILDPEAAPASELAALYPERWEIEQAFDELKTHLRGSRIVLRSKNPENVRQEVYGLLLAHFGIRTLMHDAAMSAAIDPDRLSFTHSMRVARRRLPLYAAFPPRSSRALVLSNAQGNIG